MSPKLALVFTLLVTTLAALWLDHTHITPALQEEVPASKEGSLAPNAVFTQLDGTTLPLHDLKGKPIWLHFWASWCVPCRSEFPKLLEQLKQDKNETLLLAVSADKTVLDIQRFMMPLREEFSELFDDDRILLVIDKDRKLIEDVFLTFQFPETIIIDKQMHMTRKVIGAGVIPTSADSYITPPQPAR